MPPGSPPFRPQSPRPGKRLFPSDRILGSQTLGDKSRFPNPPPAFLGSRPKKVEGRNPCPRTKRKGPALTPDRFLTTRFPCGGPFVKPPLATGPIPLQSTRRPILTQEPWCGLLSVPRCAPRASTNCLWPGKPRRSTGAERNLLETMAAVRLAARLGHSVRAGRNLKVRQPLAKALIATDPRHRRDLEHLLGLLADELNVKASRTSWMRRASW